MEEQKKVSSKNPKPASSALDAEMERLRRDIFRSDMEKFRLFTRMLRNNALFKKAVVTHK